MLKIENLNKKFSDGTIALTNINLDVSKGDIFGIMGLSGAGKSTLVRCINGLETFNSGKIYFNDKLLCGYDSNGKFIKVAREDKKKIAIVFQSFNLLEQRTVIKNIELVGELSKDPNTKEKALKYLNLVGLKNKKDRYPSTLSGGECQRVAIARALMSEPDILLCDEVTSALDRETTESILMLLKKLNKELGLTILIIAHQMMVLDKICNKIAFIDNSTIVEQGNYRDIFLNPKSDIGKRLIYGGHIKEEFSEEGLIRITYTGEVEKPIICNLIKELDVIISIVHANSKIIDGMEYGQAIIKLANYKKDVEKVKKYLIKEKVKFEEIKDRGQSYE